jgi:hypothetical protein
MRQRTPSLDWIAKVLGETAEDRGEGKRPVLRLVSGAAVAPRPESVRPISLELVRNRLGPRPRPKTES